MKNYTEKAIKQLIQNDFISWEFYERNLNLFSSQRQNISNLIIKNALKVLKTYLVEEKGVDFQNINAKSSLLEQCFEEDFLDSDFGFANFLNQHKLPNALVVGLFEDHTQCFNEKDLLTFEFSFFEFLFEGNSFIEDEEFAGEYIKHPYHWGSEIILEIVNEDGSSFFTLSPDYQTYPPYNLKITELSSIVIDEETVYHPKKESVFNE